MNNINYKEIKEIKDNKGDEEIKKDDSYNNFFKDTPVIMVVINPQTAKIIDANPFACSFYQYSYDDMLKLKISDINISSIVHISAEMKSEALNRKIASTLNIDCQVVRLEM